MKELTSDKKMLEYGIMKPYSNISCFSTTRHGGCSEGNYATMNCTYYCGDDIMNVQKNLEILGSLLPKRPHVFVIPRQTHTTNVQVITGMPNKEDLQDVDAVITNLPGYCMCVSTADCIPILLYDKKRQVVAAVHAGWRGTVGRIVERTIKKMMSVYGTDSEDIVACLGPGISLESFEVGDEVYESFRKEGFDMSLIASKYKKWHIDLWKANQIQLLNVGVKLENIEIAGICTYKDCDNYFSARRLGVDSGRMLSGIMIHECDGFENRGIGRN